MLSSSSSPLPASTDIAFFSSPKTVVRNASTPPPTNVLTKTRVKRLTAPQPQRSLSSSTSLSSCPPLSSSPGTSGRSSPLSSNPPSPPGHKRKSPELVEDLTAVPAREVKRPKTASAKSKSTKRKGSGWTKPWVPPAARPRTLAPSPQPIYRNSRSRSTSTFPNPDSGAPAFKRVWRTDENGYPGETHISSETVVKRLMKKYKAYFNNPNDPNDKKFEPHPTDYPVVELEYPNSDAVERFILLAPKDKDHYNPIMDLESSLCTMIEFYLTKEQQTMFGPNPNDWRTDELSPPPSPSPSPPSSLDPSSSRTSLKSSGGSSTSSTYSRSGTPLIRAFKRAIHLQDGPMFLTVMEEVNAVLRSFKYPEIPDDIIQPTEPNQLMRAPDTWSETGVPKKVLMRLIEENYQRTVGPNVPKLKRYEAFSSTVYGELMPNLVDEMITITNLNEDSLFLDLGSGVGNVVVQAGLQTGCKSFGIELMPEPARVAEDMVEQMKIRCRMWGLRTGEVELEKGDMLTSKRVDELMSKADVVLVDNKVFEESLNEALKPKFLDLKEGAIVISLAPFVSSLNARVTERNVDDITAIFDVTEREYMSGSVSWGNNGGSYYLHRVDRTGYAEIREKFENARAQMRPLRRRS